MKFADCSPCNALISFMTHCPLITLIFGIAIPLYIGYLGAVSSNYNIVVNVEFENYLQAESKLQSMDNAYVRLVEEQATIVEESRKRRLKQAERRPVFSLLLFYQIRDKSYSSPNRANALNDFFVHSDDSQDNGQNPTRGIFHEEALKEIRYVENLIAGFEGYENYCYRLQKSSQCATPTTPVNFFFSSYTMLNVKENTETTSGQRLTYKASKSL